MGHKTPSNGASQETFREYGSVYITPKIEQNQTTSNGDTLFCSCPLIAGIGTSTTPWPWAQDKEDEWMNLRFAGREVCGHRIGSRWIKIQRSAQKIEERKPTSLDCKHTDTKKSKRNKYWIRFYKNYSSIALVLWWNVWNIALMSPKSWM